MDLKRIGTKLEKNEYIDERDFLYDIRLLFSNCRLFNPVNSVYYKCAEEVEDHFSHTLALFEQSIK